MSSSDLNKATQKVKEAMSRMNKNELAFCIVNLEALSYTDLKAVAKATMDFKAGKDTYMCDGKFICLVSYEENDKINDIPEDADSENNVIIDPTIKDVTANRINIAINIADELYQSSHAGYVGYGSLDRNGNDPEMVYAQIDGLITYLSAFKECTDVSYDSYNYQTPRSSVGVYDKSAHHGMQTLTAHVFVDECPFKTIDEVMNRFYDLMRERGLLIDDEEEDMGAIADAAGIEW
jgi:hypothetical protein